MCGLRDSSIESGTSPFFLLSFPFLSLPYLSPSSSREGQSRAKVLSNMVKQKRKEKAVSNHIFELFIKCQPCCQYLIFTHRANGQCLSQRCVPWGRMKFLRSSEPARGRVSFYFPIYPSQMTCISILLLFSLIREELEADGHQGYICGWGLHKKTTQIWKIYPTYGTCTS